MNYMGQYEDRFKRIANGEPWGAVFGSLSVDSLARYLIEYTVKLHERVESLEAKLKEHEEAEKK